MFYKTVLTYFAAMLLSPLFMQAQVTEVVRCHTMEADAALRAEYPELGTLEEFEDWFNPMVRAYEQANQNREFAPVLNVPVVFHLIHDNEAVGTGGNLDPIYVNAQLEQLNNDFRKITGTSGDNSNSVGADTEVQFCMAAVDPNGNVMAEPGMNRIDAIAKGWNSSQYCTGSGPLLNIDYIEETVKPESQWNPDNYLNIWVLEMSCGLLGYAQFPSNSGLDGFNQNGGDAITDGVVVLNTSVGSTDTPHPQGGVYSMGRTLTHEIGHWIGLRHIWGDGGCGQDDFCADTPEADGSNSGCGSKTSCGTPDMIENYMDYSNDVCMNIFTEDQKTRIRTVMDPNTNCPRRWVLDNSTVCDLTTKVSFVSANSMIDEATTNCNSAGSRTVNIPMSINIAPASNVTVNLSYSGSATQNKDFSAPASLIFPSGQTTNQNIAVTIFEDGATENDETLNISFTVSGADVGNIASHAATIVNDDVAPSASNVSTTFLSEDFNSGASGWIIGDGSNDGDTWQYATHSSSNSLNGSAMALCDSDEAGNVTLNEILTSPVVNPGNATALTLEFDQFFDAFAGLFDTNESATVEVFDGTAWVEVYELAESDGDQGNWNAPDQQSIDITAHANPNLQVRFTYNANNDNHWAIDNVKISGLGQNEIQTAVNTANGFAEHDFGPMETIHFYDQATGNMMLTLENNSNYDYGCTKVEIDRAGETAESSWQNGRFTTGKSFLITPTNNSPSASDSYTITLYYTEAEINNWVSQSGASQGDLRMAKTAGSISAGNNGNSEVSDATEGTFGTDYTYSATFNSGFSGFAMGNVQNAALPVELLDFKAVTNQKAIDLIWETAQEINNKGFEIQRSQDNGKTFETIGWADGNGNSEVANRYIFKDENVVAEQVYYYRLRQVDFDETASFSKIVNAKMSGQGTVFTLAPNPVRDALTVKFSGNIAENATLEILDIQGRVVMIKNQVSPTTTLSVGTLPTGVYFVKMQNGAETTVKRLVKK